MAMQDLLRLLVNKLKISHLATEAMTTTRAVFVKNLDLVDPPFGGGQPFGDRRLNLTGPMIFAVSLGGKVK
jgi:hypothetical protein